MHESVLEFWVLMKNLNFCCPLFFNLVSLVRGFPVWLKYVPGIKFRTDNEPFKVCPLLVNIEAETSLGMIFL